MIDWVKDEERDVEFCTYFIESSRSKNVTGDMSKPSKAYSWIEQHLHTDKMASFDITSVSGLCMNYYTTDHHWNYRGSYKGYKEIMELLGRGKAVQQPIGTQTFPVVFNGSLAKAVKDPMSQEYFTVYRFQNVPGYTSYVNGKKKAYDGISRYNAYRYSTDAYTDHYSSYYGSNQVAEVILDTGNDRQKDLLVITNSFGVPVIEMLAMHYNRVISINLRYYREQMGKDFNLTEYLNSYDISQVLILGDFTLYCYPDTFGEAKDDDMVAR